MNTRKEDGEIYRDVDRYNEAATLEHDPVEREYLILIAYHMSFLIRHIVNRVQAPTGCTDFDAGKRTFDEIDALITAGYIPVASPAEMVKIEAFQADQLMGEGTCWEGQYDLTNTSQYIQVRHLDFTGEAAWINRIGMESGFVFLGNHLDFKNLTNQTKEIFGRTGDVSEMRFSNMTTNALGGGDNALLLDLLGGNFDDITGVNLNITDLGAHHKSFIGVSGAGLTSAISISNVNLEGAISGNAGANSFDIGPFGRMKGSASFALTMTDCYTDVYVDNSGGANWVGAFAGSMDYCTATRCYSLGNVDTTSGFGASAFVGELGTNVILKDCYSRGYVDGNNETGGLVGRVFGSGCTIDNCYSVGLVDSTTGTFEGGMIGRNFGAATITASYWDTVTSGKATSDGGVGKTTSELQTPTSATGIYSAWTDPAWDFGTASEYPILT